MKTKDSLKLIFYSPIIYLIKINFQQYHHPWVLSKPHHLPLISITKHCYATTKP